ncbi:dihydrofolate reductase, partial [Candidatus Saccharibacteria bacterium]|nr:dihydrofolate reductase [Candidatus Saccharibacteria bacterium]
MVTIVVAMAEGNVIGARNDLPWYLPADLRHFKEITSGHTVVMGR